MGRRRDSSGSEDAYVDSDEELPVLSAADGSGGGQGGKSVAQMKRKRGPAQPESYAWEAQYHKSWERVQEDRGGLGSTQAWLAAARRRRDVAEPLQRGILRHVVLVLDLSEAVLEADLRPSRFELLRQYTRQFVTEFYDQNPIGQLALLATRSGVAERLVPMGANPTEFLQVLQAKRALEPRGEPSLQNALEMARGSMAHLPSTNSREVVLLWGSLTTQDPGNIHATIDDLARDGVRVSCVSLSAEVKVLHTLTSRTGGQFSVALDEDHLRQSILDLVPPPPLESTVDGTGVTTSNGGSGAEDARQQGDWGELLCLGFPTRLAQGGHRTLCACHAKPRAKGYICARCGAQMCDVPTDCPVCGLTAILSTHLARSYHHLLPVPPYTPLRWSDVFGSATAVEAPGAVGAGTDADAGGGPGVAGRARARSGRAARETRCFSCHATFRSISFQEQEEEDAEAERMARETEDAKRYATSGRYACRRCHRRFCIECDTFVHDVLHVCPGCV